MSRKNRKVTKQKFERQNSVQDFLPSPYDTIKPETKRIVPLNKKQREYINLINTKIVTISTGAPGTSKTMWPTILALQALSEKKIERIYLTRPHVTSFENNIGAIPGTILEKFAPFIAPIRNIAYKIFGSYTFFDYCLEKEKIVVIPIAYMRGLTFDDCYVIMDEAQELVCHTTVDGEQSTSGLLLLSRIGQNCKMIITGDTKQMNKPGMYSGLTDIIEKIGDMDEVGVINFEKSDIVRSDFVKKLIEKYY